MASFRKRGDIWRAEIALMGVRRSASFPSKRQAQTWAAEVEADILAGKLLRELGIRRAEVDAEQWRPDEADLLRPTRPDSKVRMQAANELASMMAQRVQLALDNYQANPASASDAMAFFDELDQKIETAS